MTFPRVTARSLFVAACALTVTSAVQAQKPPVLFGVVTNLNGVRIGGVEMTIATTALRVVTNDSGEFTFDTPPTGRIHLLARRLGFKPQDHGIKIDAGASKQEDFELEGIAELMDSVRIVGQLGNGKMAEFWNRRAVGIGAFITRRDIERRGAYRSSDLLRTVNGVRVNQENGMGQAVISMGRTAVTSGSRRGVTSLAGNCVVNYYIDGNWTSPGNFHLDDLSPAAIEAIEIYRGPSEIPPRFRQRETACGLIVIWTREPPAREKPDPSDRSTE